MSTTLHEEVQYDMNKPFSTYTCMIRQVVPSWLSAAGTSHVQ